MDGVRRTGVSSNYVEENIDLVVPLKSIAVLS